MNVERKLHICYSHYKLKKIILTKTTLHANVLARDLKYVKLISPAGLAEIWVALSHGEVAGTLFRVALGLAAAAWEAILALAAALAELLAEVLCLNARAGVVARPVRVVARREVVHVVGAWNN